MLGHRGLPDCVDTGIVPSDQAGRLPRKRALACSIRAGIRRNADLPHHRNAPQCAVAPALTTAGAICVIQTGVPARSSRVGCGQFRMVVRVYGACLCRGQSDTAIPTIAESTQDGCDLLVGSARRVLPSRKNPNL
jgi:hypothetical protein